MIQWIIENQGFPRTSLEGTPAAILLDSGPLKDIEIRDVSFRSSLKPEDKVTGTRIAGLRLASDAQVDSLRVSGLTIEGYETGVIIDEGAQAEGVRLEGVTMRDVERPWVIPDREVESEHTTLALR